MYLTAQRVISPEGNNGINAFLYEHGQNAWEAPPELVPGSFGTLMNMSLLVTPVGANEVVSYVDIVAPDGADWEIVSRQLFDWTKGQASAKSPLPWSAVMGDYRFVLHMTAFYAKDWKSEVGVLIGACRRALEERTPAEQLKTELAASKI